MDAEISQIQKIRKQKSRTWKTKTIESQKNIVVVCVSPEHFSLKFGNALKLVYTAISRAQKKLIIVGDSKIFFKSQYVTEHKFITSFMEQFTEIETPDWL